MYSFMFGFEPTGNYSVTEYLSYIESKFLVLIYERLPEAMIMMKRKLCWGMKDVLYSHARRAVYKKPAVNETLVKLHKSWSPLDYIFYDHFTKVLEHTISIQDETFSQEVALFEEYSQKTGDFCANVCRRLGSLIKDDTPRISLENVLFDYELFDRGPWDLAFNITGLDCIMMVLDPVIYREAQKVHLFPENCKTDHRDHRTLKVDHRYCGDYFAYNLPWEALYKSSFVSDCY